MLVDGGLVSGDEVLRLPFGDRQNWFVFAYHATQAFSGKRVILARCYGTRTWTGFIYININIIGLFISACFRQTPSLFFQLCHVFQTVGISSFPRLSIYSNICRRIP